MGGSKVHQEEAERERQSRSYLLPERVIWRAVEHNAPGLDRPGLILAIKGANVERPPLDGQLRRVVGAPEPFTLPRDGIPSSSAMARLDWVLLTTRDEAGHTKGLEGRFSSQSMV